MNYSPYDVTHLLTQMQILFFSALAFVWLNLKGLYPPELRSTHLDFDWFYRKLFPNVWAVLTSHIVCVVKKVTSVSLFAIDRLIKFSVELGHPTSVLARNWGVNSMLLALLAIMAIVLLFNYL